MTKDGKIMVAITAPNLRLIVSQANEFNIEREDIVSLTKVDTNYILVYYGKGK